MTDAERELFDVLLEQVIEELPAGTIDEMPYIVDDEPDNQLMVALDIPHDQRETICGAFQMFRRRKRTIRMPFRPKTSSQVYLFREGIVTKAGGWTAENANARIKDQIRETMREQIIQRMVEEDIDGVNTVHENL